MIKIKQDSKTSINLIFDVYGAGLLLSRMKLPGDTTVKLDEVSLTLTKKTIDILKIIINEEYDRILTENSTLILELDSDTLKYFGKRLEDCLNGEDFYPAELCEANFRKWKINIYAFLTK